LQLSIIIPIFKVEEYIEKCLTSLINQGLPLEEYEIICINDGSPDNSAAKVIEFQKKYANIILINQENQGVSVARNRGLDSSQGDYILFVDPDDSVYENAIPVILKHAKDNNLDVLYLSLDLFDEENNFLFTAEKCGNDGVVMNGFEHSNRTYPATLYKKTVIDNIRFIKGITRGQDTVFNAMVQSCALRCSYFTTPYYKYLQRKTSSRQYVGNENAFNGCLLAIEEVNNFKKTFFPNATDKQKHYFDKVQSLFIQRAFEWNIIPNLDKIRFLKLKQKVEELKLSYLMDDVAQKVNKANKSFYKFKVHHKIKHKKNKILKFLSRVKKELLSYKK
jgi:glycosyltransferase involved in cell wall biosynthesis